MHSILSGIKRLCKIRLGGLLWIAPVCSSWVMAPIVHTCLRILNRYVLRVFSLEWEGEREIPFVF